MPPKVSHKRARNLSISSGSAIPNLSAEQINVTVMAIPPLAEQKRIVAKVDQMMALVDALETQIARSRTTGEKLLDALVAELTATDIVTRRPMKRVLSNHS